MNARTTRKKHQWSANPFGFVLQLKPIPLNTAIAGVHSGLAEAQDGDDECRDAKEQKNTKASRLISLPAIAAGWDFESVDPIPELLETYQTCL